MLANGRVPTSWRKVACALCGSGAAPVQTAFMRGQTRPGSEQEPPRNPRSTRTRYIMSFPENVPGAEVERAAPHAGLPHRDRFGEDGSHLALPEPAEVGPIDPVAELPGMQVKSVDAASPLPQFPEQSGLLDGDFGMDEECDREAELAGPVDIAPDEPLAVLPAPGPGRCRVGIVCRGLDIHGDDDVQRVHGHLLRFRARQGRCRGNRPMLSVRRIADNPRMARAGFSPHHRGVRAR